MAKIEADQLDNAQFSIEYSERAIHRAVIQSLTINGCNNLKDQVLMSTHKRVNLTTGESDERKNAVELNRYSGIF